MLKPLITAAVVAAGALTAQSAAAEAVQAKTVVMVHGAFADGSAWNKVIPFLTDAGLNVVAVQNAMDSMTDDAANTLRAVEAAEGPVVLVGHSYGGMVISEMGDHEKVASLVYVAAFAPDKGQQLVDTLAEHGAGPGFKSPIVDEAGFISLSEDDIVNHFAHDLPTAEAQLIAYGQGPIHDDAIHTPTTAAAWENKPNYAIVTLQDDMIPPVLLQEFAEKIDAKTTELPASHVPMLSMPRAVADVILDAAGAS